MTKIEWTEKSWNPVTGCTKCSPGCANCYAEGYYQKCIKEFGLTHPFTRDMLELLKSWDDWQFVNRCDTQEPKLKETNE